MAHNKMSNHDRLELTLGADQILMRFIVRPRLVFMSFVCLFLFVLQQMLYFQSMPVDGAVGCQKLECEVKYIIAHVEVPSCGTYAWVAAVLQLEAEL